MKVSWDDDIPKIWKKHVPNQQPVIIITIILIITIIIIINIIIIKIRIGFDPSPSFHHVTLSPSGIAMVCLPQYVRLSLHPYGCLICLCEIDPQTVHCALPSNINWLVVLTILKNMSQSMGRMTSHILWKIIHSCSKPPTSQRAGD